MRDAWQLSVHPVFRLYVKTTKIKLGANYISSNTELSTNNKTTPDIHRKRTGTRRLSKKNTAANRLAQEQAIRLLGHG
jgi:hypothetical protein